MNWQFTPFLIPTFLSAGVAGAIALLALKRRRSPGAYQLLILMAAVVLWCLGYALELAAAGLAEKNFGALVKYLGVVLVSPAFLVFALKYSGREKWLTLRLLCVLAVEPALFLLLSWTNDFHGLVWSSVRLEEFGSYKARVTSYGWAFYIHALYGYVTLLFGSILMLGATFRRHSLFRGQGAFVVIAVLTPVLGNILYLTRLNPFRPFDLTPFSFVVTGVSLALSIFKFQLLNIVPIAHDQVIRSMQDGFIALDNLDRIVEMNPAAQKITGVNDLNYLGKRIAEVFSFWPEFHGHYRQTSPDNPSILAGPPGSQRFYEVQILSLQHDRGSPAGRLLVLHDMTERKRTEEALQRSQSDLERRVEERTWELKVVNHRLQEEIQERRKTQAILSESEELYRQLVEQPFDGVYVHRGGNVIYVNKTAVRLLGAENRDQILGRSILEFIHSDCREFVSRRIEAITEGAREVPLAEEKFIRLDGKVIDVEVAGTILMYEGLASVMVVFRDITERKAAEKKIRIAHDELEDRVKERTAALEQSNLRLEIEIAERKRAEEEMRKARDFAEAASRAKSDFLATMSHELRTPLNHIIGFTEMVVDKQFGPLNESQEEYLNDVLESSRHLLGLINDILDLAKVEAGKMALELEQVPLRALLEGSLTMVQEKALQDRISLSAELGELPDWVEGDGRKLKQVMFNLLSNAVKFTPEGGRVTVKAAPVAFPEADPNRFAAPAPVSLKNGDGSPPQTGGGLMISVEDTGIGIRAEDLERIFKPFEQVAGPLNRRHNGTGLGLPLSRRMIELHGGRIWAESEGLAKGSAFRFVLPFHLIPREGKSLWTQEPS